MSDLPKKEETLCATFWTKEKTKMPFRHHFNWEFKVTNSNQASYVRFSCARSIFVLRWLPAKTSPSLLSGSPSKLVCRPCKWKFQLNKKTPIWRINWYLCAAHLNPLVGGRGSPYPLWHPVRQFAGKRDEGKVLEFSKVITALLLYILPLAIDDLTRPLCDTKTNLYP